MYRQTVPLIFTSKNNTFDISDRLVTPRRPRTWPLTRHG